jgi:hypothetical protein
LAAIAVELSFGAATTHGWAAMIPMIQIKSGLQRGGMPVLHPFRATKER